MSKNYIVTFYDAWNYGACLQAFASLLVMRAVGIDVLFLNYVNDYAKHKRASDYLKDSDYILALKTFIKDYVFRRKFYTEKAFGNFCRSLPKTDVYRCSDDFDSINADLLISGSDQVWNPEITGDLDEIFYLNFGKSKKRISFASSLGNHCYTEEEKVRVKILLESFDAISVREQFAVEQVQPLTNRNVFRCLDPTLLIDPDIWRSFANRPKDVKMDDDFILIFNLAERKPREESLWKKKAEELRCSVWRIANNSFPQPKYDRVLKGITPYEFLYLIDHAKYVFTDSFHGTAFSANLNTPFMSMTPIRGNVARITDFLSLTGLDDTFNNLNSAKFFTVGFNNSNQRLSLERSKCYSWINEAVNTHEQYL